MPIRSQKLFQKLKHLVLNLKQEEQTKVFLGHDDGLKFFQ